MKLKTNTTKRMYRQLLPKLVMCILALSPFAMITTSHAQTDSCSAKAYFNLTTLDHKNITITNYSSGSNLKYLWTFMDGTSSTDPNPGTHFYNDLAMHYIYLQVTDTIKNCTSSYLDTIPSICSAAFSFTNDHHDFTFTNKSNGPATIFNWNFGDGSTSSLANPSHHYVNTGSYTTCLTIMSTLDSNCSDTKCASINVSDLSGCTANFSAKANPTNRYTYVLNNYSTGSDLTYLWNFGDGQQSNLQNPTHTYTSSGTFVICLTIQSLSDSTCSDKHYDSVNIISAGLCNGYFTLQKDSTDNHKYYVTNLSSGTTSNYEWDFGDGYTTNGINPGPHSYNKAGRYMIMLRGECADDPVHHKFDSGLAVNVSFDESCKALFTIAPDSSTTDPYDFIIYNQSSGTNLTYHWNFGDGYTSNLVNPVHAYIGTGPYIIYLAVGNANCFNEYHDTLQISDTLHHMFPGKFHITVVDKTVTGIKKNDAGKVTLLNYPNPFNGTTTISYSISASSSVELEVYDLLGVKVATIEGGTKAPGKYTLEWNAQHLQEGIYLLQLKTTDQSITKKVILTK